jgi:hypothetical protein
VTAALAKAISEPPPSIRRQRPDVPKALERVVMKGLERDRGRRYSSLEELRDALQQLLPDEQVPARTRMLLAAYLVDMLQTIFLVQIPVELLEWLAGLRRGVFIGVEGFIDPLVTLGYLLYFAGCEGFVGATIGKWLLGLRLVPLGSVGPPGFGLATLRSAIFHAGWLLVYVGLICIAEIPLFGLPLGLLLVLGGIAYLSYRFRRPNSNRGLHDLATRCHVVQLPRRPHRVRLASQAPNRLEHPKAIAGLPTNLGGYIVRGRLMLYDDGSQVWIADDRSLGRRVLIHLLPAVDAAIPPPTRPNRLRLLGSGNLEWQTRDWTWHAFAAPAGAPLADMIPADQPLNWPDARLLLEQIVEELKCAEKDGTLPASLSINQIWSEPGGRVFLLDFLLPSLAKAKSAGDSLALVRQAVTLMLEGAPRLGGGPVKAPLPPRASAIINRLFQDSGGHADLEELQCELAESHAHEPTVTTKMRATHLGVAALILTLPLFMMNLYALMLGFIATTVTLTELHEVPAVLAGLDDPSALAEWRRDPVLREPLADENLPVLGGQLQALQHNLDVRFEGEFHHLSRPERYIIVHSQMRNRPKLQASQLSASTVEEIVALAAAPDTAADAEEVRFMFLFVAAAVCGGFVAAFAVCALLFRGGIAYLLAGIALVRRDGRPVGRFRCALREIVLWMPLVAVLLSAAWVQAEWPGWFLGRMIASGCVMVVLVGYVALGFRSPEQGPHDRLFGIWRVPA